MNLKLICKSVSSLKFNLQQRLVFISIRSALRVMIMWDILSNLSSSGQVLPRLLELLSELDVLKANNSVATDASSLVQLSSASAVTGHSMVTTAAISICYPKIILTSSSSAFSAVTMSTMSSLGPIPKWWDSSKLVMKKRGNRSSKHIYLRQEHTQLMEELGTSNLRLVIVLYTSFRAMRTSFSKIIASSSPVTSNIFHLAIFHGWGIKW